MAYPVISSRRMPYDIDGTEVAVTNEGYSSDWALGPKIWFTSVEKQALQNQATPAPTANRDNTAIAYSYYYTSDRQAYWFFLPEVTEISHIAFVHRELDGPTKSGFKIEGSLDTTNGKDGTWEAAVWVPYISENEHAWRNPIMPVSFSGPVKVLRVLMYSGSSDINYLNSIHFYGLKAAGETPDDILFVDASTGLELTALTDWGDRPEGTTQFRQVKVKNASTTKTANNINLQLNHTDFLMSWNSGGPWTSVLDITSLGAGSQSSPIYLKNELGPPLLILGPKDGRIIASVGSWT